MLSPFYSIHRTKLTNRKWINKISQINKIPIDFWGDGLASLSVYYRQIVQTVGVSGMWPNLSAIIAIFNNDAFYFQTKKTIK